MRNKRSNSANQIVRESLTQALFQLMKTVDFDKISVASLVEKAGVARVSYYRNYQNKESIISEFLIEHLIETFENQYIESDMHHFWQFCFESFKAISEQLKLITKSDLMWLIYPTVLEILKLDYFNVQQLGKVSQLTHSAVAGLITGILIEWVNHDFFENAEELAQVLMMLNLNEENN